MATVKIKNVTIDDLFHLNRDDAIELVFRAYLHTRSIESNWTHESHPWLKDEENCIKNHIGEFIDKELERYKKERMNNINYEMYLAEDD